ncbi:MAG: hypothetical protein KC547_04175 [Anaerolineae bacterium]|nr:hypothetical protein [Anaerolineae bacterium]
MPLGDSVTQGSSAWNSYRRPLWQLLQFNGESVNFVGSQNGNLNFTPPPDTVPPPNPDFDLDHEGHWGFTSAQILAQLPTWAAVRPEIVLLHLGTNDVTTGVPVATTIDNLGQIIDTLRGARSNVIILLAQIIPNAGFDVTPLNAAIATLASQKNTTQSPVILVDQFTGFDATAGVDTHDGTHPNDAGEIKMASRWFDALEPILNPPPTAGPTSTPTLYIFPTYTLTPTATATPLPTNTPTATPTSTPDPRLMFQTAVPEVVDNPQSVRAVRPNGEHIVDTIRPTFEWRLATGQRTYRLQVDNDRTFLSPVLERIVEGGVYTIPNREDGLPQGIYFWRVSPEGSEGWSEIIQFTVFIGKRPADGSYTEDHTPRFTWAYTPNVRTYVFELSRDGNFTDLLIDARVESTTVFVAPEELPFGIYYWRVYPLGDPPFGNVRRLLAISPPPPPAPARVEAPLPGSTIGELNATFTWEAVAGAASYEIEISDSLAFDNPFSLTTTEPTFTMDQPIARGTYFWRIRSLNEYGVNGLWTQPQSFTVERASGSVDTPTPTPTNTPTATPDGSSG